MRDDGAALILVLMATTLMAALGSGLIVLSTMERRMAANHRWSIQTMYGAEAGIERGVAELRRVARWSDVLTGAVASTFTDSTRRPLLPAPGRVDLDAITAELQAESNSASSWGPNNPVWRLFAWGSLAAMTGTPAQDTRIYVAVWVADDGAETDDDPRSDANNVVLLHAEAYGLAGARQVVDATAARVAGDVRVLAWR